MRNGREYIAQDIIDDDGFVIGHHNREAIVRCKDCKHKYVSGNGTTQYYVCDFMDAQYEDDGFCSHGKRRGDANE